MNRYISILVLVAVLVGCSDELPLAKLPAAEEVLAQYQTIYIGSKKITLPTIALLASTKHSALTLDDHTQVPIGKVLSQGANGTKVSLIRLNIHSYRELQDYDIDAFAYVSAEFCKKLVVNWERNQCAKGLYDGKHSFYPQHFNIIELKYLVNSNAKLFSIAGAGPDGGDAARTLLAKKLEAQVMCIEAQKPLCTAVMPITNDIIAVWATRQAEFGADKARISWLMDQYLEKTIANSPTIAD